MKTMLCKLGLLVIAVWSLLSVFGAFIGAERGSAFFNSVPLAVFWVVFLALLVIAILAFKNIQMRPMLFLVHLSCIFIFIGAMSGSKAVFQYRNKGERPYKGYIKLYAGQKASQAYIQEENRFVNLDFEVGLQDFQILYYDNPLTMLHIQSVLGTWQVPAAKGTEYELSEQAGKVRVLDAFANLKIRMDNGKPVASEGPAVESNPAWLLEFVAPDGEVTQQFVFEKFSGHSMPDQKFLVSVQKQGAIVKDYVSDVVIIQDDKLLARKKVEVNHPLFFGDYGFYQSSCGQDEQGMYSILQMVSHHGVQTVFAGYLLLAIALFVYFGFKIIQQRNQPHAG